MFGKMKSGILLVLIGLSLLQTYLLWFGRQLPTEEGTLPRYEQAFFTEPPPTSRLIQPLDVTAEYGESTYLFRRGEKVHDFFWQECFALMTNRLGREQFERIQEEEKERLMEMAQTRIHFSFSYPVPSEIIFAETPIIMDVESIYLIWEDEQFHILLTGEDMLLFRVPAQLGLPIMGHLDGLDMDTYKTISGEMELHVLHPEKPQPELKLVTAREIRETEGSETGLDTDEQEGEVETGLDTGHQEDGLDPNAGAVEERVEENEEADAFEESVDARDNEHDTQETEEMNAAQPTGENGRREETDAEAVAPGAEPIPKEVWRIQVEGQILVPEGQLWAAERGLFRENMGVEQLVRAFFIDTSMARRIEERDDAVYFTDGERGLRIYPSGRVEYTAPRLEHILSRVSYYSALQKGAENLSLYGGWSHEAFLHKVEQQPMGYRLTWQMFHDGLRLAGEHIGCTMVINEQGVPYYQRHFPEIGEALFESKPFRSPENALLKAIEMDKEAFQDNRARLISLEPVYYVPSSWQQKQIVPAWKIEFQETGPVYLHWQSLDPLN